MFNKGSYINRAIESLQAQTVAPHQIIIIDDASTDNGSLIAKEFAQNNPGYIQYHLNETNKGASYTRNKGIQLANSAYIMFLDADDEYASDFIAIVQAQINNNPSENIFIAACTYFPSGFLYPLLPKKFVLDFIQQVKYTDQEGFIPFVGGSNVVLKKSLITASNTGFDVNEKNYEDWLFYYSLLKANEWQFTFINKGLYIYHENVEGSLSNKSENYQNIVTPKVVQKLQEWQYPNTAKLVFSIWLSSSYTKINSRYNYGKFLFKQGKIVLKNGAINKYTLQVASKILFPSQFVSFLKNKIRKKA